MQGPRPPRDRALRAIALVLALAPLTACSLLTTWDGLPLGSLGDGGVDVLVEGSDDTGLATEASSDSGLSHDADGTAPSDAANDGPSVKDSSPPVDVGPDTPPPPMCTVGRYYCGGHVVSGNSDSLYRCTGGTSGTDVGTCSDGCQVNQGTDDVCRGAGGCVNGGLYCGGDKVTGNPLWLYSCSGGSTGSLNAMCQNGCTINAGANDSCAP